MKKPKIQPVLKQQPKPEPEYRYVPYDAKELKPFDARPGAMDAFKLPSRGIA